MLTTQQVYRLSMEQHQQSAKPDARWKSQGRAFALLLSRFGLSGQAAQQAPQPEIAARSLDGFQVFANIGHGHPVANRGNLGGAAVRVSHASNANISSFDFCSNGFVIEAATGGNGGGLNFEECLHLVSPVDVLNIAHVALINTTVYRKVTTC